MVAILGVLVILGALVAVWFFVLPSRKAGKTPPAGPPQAALARAHDVECRNNLQQIRAALQMAQAEGNNPPDLASLNLGEGLLKCPVGGEPYRYDPQTAQVSCPHAGHEKF
jgi:hypothetical protein